MHGFNNHINQKKHYYFIIKNFQVIADMVKFDHIQVTKPIQFNSIQFVSLKPST